MYYVCNMLYSSAFCPRLPIAAQVPDQGAKFG